MNPIVDAYFRFKHLDRVFADAGELGPEGSLQAIAGDLCAAIKAQPVLCGCSDLCPPADFCERCKKCAMGCCICL